MKSMLKEVKTNSGVQLLYNNTIIECADAKEAQELMYTNKYDTAWIKYPDGSKTRIQICITKGD